jgi:hypothetical protein
MKKLLLFSLLVSAFVQTKAQTVVSAVVPEYIQGLNGTNNNRTPFWFWAEITGLTPGATYRYYTTMDSLTALATSNGAGNCYLVNASSGTVRRTSNTSLLNNTGHDSLVADLTGSAHGWFGVEPTGNGRFTPGHILYPKIILNNGAGGTSVASRVLLSLYPVTVINYGTTSGSPVEGSALYDSLDATAKNFICLYGNMLATGRPVSIAIVEDDAMYLNVVTSIAPFYRNMVDSMAGHWGTIIPNNLSTGIRSLEERDFTTGVPVDTTMDSDGFWCSGVNTVNMSNGNSALYLNSTFVFTSSATIPDTTWTGLPTAFTAMSNDTNATFDWNFGDTNTGSGESVQNTYANPGVYLVTVIITNGGCSDTISQPIVVELSTSIPTVPTLWFGVAPNPTSGELVLTTKDNNVKTVTVLNMLGETISSQQINGSTLRLDITGNPAGIYFVRMKDEATGRTGIRKIVLQ